MEILDRVLELADEALKSASSALRAVRQVYPDFESEAEYQLWQTIIWLRRIEDVAEDTGD